MAYTTIKKPSDYFNPVAYAGDGTSDRAVTSGFATDFVWIKNRNTTDDHVIFDKVRGGTKYIYTNATQAESTFSSLDLTFESTGVNVGSYTTINNNGSNLISYHWKANGAGASNTDGSITSTVSANTTSGFSIVSYTGNATVSTVGHGLGVAPKMIIIKNRSRTDAWPVDCRQVGGTLYLNETGTLQSYADASPFPSTAPTSTVFSIGTAGNANFSGSDLIAYCFAEKQGFSKFGSYVGNGNADGTFVYTGFKPAFVMGKATSGTENWFMNDNKRLGYNDKNYRLYPNLSNNEATDINMDIFSNGFKLNSTNGNSNGSGITYIYMAFAEEPLVGDNPCTAR